MTALPPSDPDSGWENHPSGTLKFMAWALVSLILTFVAVGLLFRLI
jgi:hypothetical protein